ncbi:zinc transporter ZIP1-like [Liolophura sinensis]|uniref:zinc transporter ZIP1-like n=1 Tax=Liolophura sinensis TaxID=3198878 RepID=UPI0031589386
MRVEVVKGLVLVGLFLMTFLLGLLPVKIVKVVRQRSVQRGSRQTRYKRVMSLFSCYAAGVFLATCLLDLFPDVRDKLSDVLDEAQIYTSFPVPEFVMVCGLFLILTVEQIVLFCKESKDFLRHSHDAAKTSPMRDHRSLSRSAEFSPRSLNCITDRPRSATFSSPGTVQRGERGSDESSRVPLLRNESHDHSHDHSFVTEAQDHSTFRSLLLLLALSLHSVFEGLAVGLQQKAVDVLAVFAALALHKCVLSFSLGLSLVQSELSNGGIIRSVVLFSLSSPLGIGIGLCITDLSNTNATHLAEGILQGIACGTFLYVTFFEMLPHEFHSSDDRLMKVLCLLLGYSTVTVILFFHNNVEKPTCFRGPGPFPSESYNATT